MLGGWGQNPLLCRLFPSPPGLGLRERNLVTQDFLLMALCQKSKLSTEAGTQGQVRASLRGYGFWGVFRDEGSRALGCRH